MKSTYVTAPSNLTVLYADRHPYDRVVVDRRMEEIRAGGGKKVTISDVIPIPFAYIIKITWEE